jgi:hypothetical protein
MNLDTNNYNNIQFIAFREDVFDRFNSIIKFINDDRINTDFNYNDILKDLYKDFKLINIIRLINTIKYDNEFKKSHICYKLALNYCDEIIENPIMIRNNSINYLSKEKID